MVKVAQEEREIEAAKAAIAEHEAQLLAAKHAERLRLENVKKENEEFEAIKKEQQKRIQEEDMRYVVAVMSSLIARRSSPCDYCDIRGDRLSIHERPTPLCVRGAVL